MGSTTQKVSLSSSSLVFQPSNNGAVRTVLKSTSSAKAKLELADINSFHSKRLGSLSKINNGFKPKEVEIEQGSSIQNNSRYRNRITVAKNTFSLNSSEIDSTEDNLSAMNLSFICNSSMLENVSDDINISVLAHDGSENMLVPPFQLLESDLQQHVKIPTSTLEDNSVRAQTDMDQIQMNCKKAMKRFNSGVNLTSDVTLSGSTQKPTMKNQVTSLGPAVAFDNSENLCDPEDLQNSMEISFDESRGTGPLCSSGIEFQLISEYRKNETANVLHGISNAYCADSNSLLPETTQKILNTSISTSALQASAVADKNDNNGLNTVTSESVIATGTSSSTITATSLNFTDADTAHCNSKKTNANSTSTADIDLTELARARSGNPENLYGLLAGFIKTGKHSTNTITINLNQCYNCDGSCVRNTISVLSLKNKEKLKVVEEGIVNVENLNRPIPHPHSVQDSVVPLISTEILEPEADASIASKRTKKSQKKSKKKQPQKSKSSLSLSSSNLIEVKGASIPIQPRLCPKLILMAPKFTPYDVTTTRKNNHHIQQLGPTELSVSSPTISVSPLEVSLDSELSMNIETNEANKNVTFVVEEFLFSITGKIHI